MAQLKYRGEEIEVEYSIEGEYIMATYDNPPEYPEHFIDAVNYGGVDILPILSESDQDDIYDLLIDYLY
jgi:hypothetical protein